MPYWLSTNNSGLMYNGSALGYRSPYNPLDLPPYTIRFKFSGNTKPVAYSDSKWTQVSESPSVWDYTYNNSNWNDLFYSDSGNITDILGANLVGVVSMQYTFRNFSNLVNVQPFDMSTVTDAFRMFWGCISLQSIPALDVRNTQRITGMYGMCRNLSGSIVMDLDGVSEAYSLFCMADYSVAYYNRWPNHSITSITLLNADSIQNGYSMFSYCSALTSVNGLDVCPLEYTNFMFDGCSSLQGSPALNMSQVENTAAMFRDCTALTTVPDYSDVSSVTRTDGMFKNCYNVQSGALSMYNKLVQNTYADSSKYADCFTNCGRDTVTGAAELAQIPTSWGGTAT